jgi:hypothetical protein
MAFILSYTAHYTKIMEPTKSIILGSYRNSACTSSIQPPAMFIRRFVFSSQGPFPQWLLANVPGVLRIIVTIGYHLYLAAS